jgi:hypothetical protein
LIASSSQLFGSLCSAKRSLLLRHDDYGTVSKLSTTARTRMTCMACMPYVYVGISCRSIGTMYPPEECILSLASPCRRAQCSSISLSTLQLLLLYLPCTSFGGKVEHKSIHVSIRAPKLTTLPQQDVLPTPMCVESLVAACRMLSRHHLCIL